MPGMKITTSFNSLLLFNLNTCFNVGVKEFATTTLYIAAGRCSCDSAVTDAAMSSNDHGHVVHTHVPLSPRSTVTGVNVGHKQAHHTRCTLAPYP